MKEREEQYRKITFMTDKQIKAKIQFQTQTRYMNLLLDRVEQGETNRVALINTMKNIEICIDNLKKEFNI